MSTLKRYNGTSWETIGGSITGDTLPIGSEIDYTGSSVPAGWEEVADYSTSEVNTGKTWIDGKPIYRKVVDAGSSSGSGFLTVAHNIANIDTICEYDAYMYDSSALYKLPWWNSFSEGNFYKVYVDKTNIQKHCNNNWGFSSRVIIYYTKTTD